MKTHQLKTLSEYFCKTWQCLKPFETRLNDREFKVGDNVLLIETFPESKDGALKGNRMISAKIGYILHGYQKPGYVTFSLLDIKKVAAGEKRLSQKCHNCGGDSGGQLQFCPYHLEISNASVLCNCCAGCYNECVADV